MKFINELSFGFPDAENYKRKENKDLFNKIFIKDDYLQKILNPSTSFLIGEKGTGKTAYAVFLSNNHYKDHFSSLKYIRETEYNKFLILKKEKHLNLSNYASIWKVILYLLISGEILEKEQTLLSNILQYRKFSALKEAITDYNNGAFSPEIIQGLEFVEEDKISSELIFKHLKAKGELKEVQKFTNTTFQNNLRFIQKSFEDSLKQIKLSNNHILFIDGIDIRPADIPYEDYLQCIKGLANAVWAINNDFFPNIKGTKGHMRIVLLLRPDIFASLGLQNQNNKIRSNSVLLNWQTDYISHRDSSLFKLLDHMLSIQQNTSIPFGESWDYYFPWNAPSTSDYPYPTTSFISFLRWSYHRPRDILTFLDILKENNKLTQKEFFSIKDFEDPSTIREYSIYLLGEIKDQLSFYFSDKDYEIFLKFFEYLNGNNRFDYKDFQIAFKKYEQYVETITPNKPSFMEAENVFLQFLFELNVICYKEYIENSNKPHIHFCFKDRNYANISPKIKTNCNYEIFYGLAKALNIGAKFESS